MLDVLRAFVMPWVAARRIRDQEESIRFMVRVIVDVAGTRPPADGARPRLYRVK